jgi:AI-2 transport protein TqsA
MPIKMPKLSRRKATPDGAQGGVEPILPPAHPPHEGSTVTRNSVAILAVIVTGAALYWLRGIVTPLAMALFLLIMIEGLTRWVASRLPIPSRAVGWVSAILVFLGLFGSIWVIVDGLSGIIAQGQGIGERLDQIIADIAGLFGITTPPALRDLVADLDLTGYAARAALTTQTVFSAAFFTLVYLGFMMASKRSFLKKVVALFPLKRERYQAAQIFERVRGGVEGYLMVQTVTGLMISATAWLIMVIVGLENPLFWAFLIFLVGYIPVVGGAIAAVGPPLYALVQFDSYWQAIVLFAGLQVILQVSGNFIQPRMQGDNQNIDPVTVMLFLALWSALWGIPGAFLSTPIAVMVMAITAQFSGTRWIAVLLSGDGDPYPMPPEQRKLIAEAKARRKAAAPIKFS